MRKLYTLAFATFLTLAAFAQTENTFIGTNTNWFVSSNWSLGLPVNNQTIIIPSTKSVRFNQSGSLSGIILKISGTLDMRGNTATFTGGSQIGVLSGGQITGAGTINLNGTVAYSGTTVSGPQYANPSTGNVFIAGTLPVRLREFNVNSSVNSVKISWSTELEVSVRSFAVERSTDSKTWQTISSQDAKGVTIRYAFEDLSPVTGVNYYRLKVTDLDGSSRFSTIKAVHFGNSSVNFKVFPNPAVHTLRVYVKAETGEKVQVSLVNRMGQIVRQKDVTPSTAILEFDVKNLAEGDYVVNVRGSSGLKQSRTIIISRK